MGGFRPAESQRQASYSNFQIVRECSIQVVTDQGFGASTVNSLSRQARDQFSEGLCLPLMLMQRGF